MAEVKQPLPSRWLVALGAFIMQFALGAIYSFSAYTNTLTNASQWSDQEDWKKVDTQIVFSAGLATFALVMVWAGRKLPTYGPRALGFASAIVLALGYVMASFVDLYFWGVLLFLGIVSGAGIGLGYVVPIAVGVKWFPDKKGTITGLAVAGFGFGATAWIKIADDWFDLLEDEDFGINNVWRMYGVIFFIFVAGGALLMINPLPGYKPPAKKTLAPSESVNVMPTKIIESQETEKLKELEEVVDVPKVEEVIAFTPGEMLHTREFWLIWLTFVFSGGAGLMAIGNMKIFPKEALVEYGSFTEKEASVITGNAMAYFYSIANGIGRIVWGLASEKLGRKRSVMIMCLTQGTFMLALIFAARAEYTLYVNAAVIGFNFGGNFALFPALTADTFGNKGVGQNYPWVFLAYGAGGILGPIMGGAFADNGNSEVAFAIAGVLVLISGGLIAMVKKPKKGAKADDVVLTLEIDEPRFVPFTGRSGIFHGIGYLGIAVGLIAFAAFCLEEEKHIGQVAVSVLLWVAAILTTAPGIFYLYHAHAYGAIFHLFLGGLFIAGALVFGNFTEALDNTGAGVLLCGAWLLLLIPTIVSALNVFTDFIIMLTAIVSVDIAVLFIVYDAPLGASATLLIVGALAAFYGAAVCAINVVFGARVMTLGKPRITMPEKYTKLA